MPGAHHPRLAPTTVSADLIAPKNWFRRGLRLAPCSRRVEPRPRLLAIVITGLHCVARSRRSQLPLSSNQAHYLRRPNSQGIPNCRVRPKQESHQRRFGSVHSRSSARSRLASLHCSVFCGIALPPSSPHARAQRRAVAHNPTRNRKNKKARVITEGSQVNAFGVRVIRVMRHLSKSDAKCHALFGKFREGPRKQCFCSLLEAQYLLHD